MSSALSPSMLHRSSPVIVAAAYLPLADLATGPPTARSTEMDFRQHSHVPARFRQHSHPPGLSGRRADRMRSTPSCMRGGSTRVSDRHLAIPPCNEVTVCVSEGMNNNSTVRAADGNEPVPRCGETIGFQLVVKNYSKKKLALVKGSSLLLGRSRHTREKTLPAPGRLVLQTGTRGPYTQPLLAPSQGLIATFALQPMASRSPPTRSPPSSAASKVKRAKSARAAVLSSDTPTGFDGATSTASTASTTSTTNRKLSDGLPSSPAKQQPSTERGAPSDAQKDLFVTTRASYSSSSAVMTARQRASYYSAAAERDLTRRGVTARDRSPTRSPPRQLQSFSPRSGLRADRPRPKASTVRKMEEEEERQANLARSVAFHLHRTPPTYLTEVVAEKALIAERVRQDRIAAEEAAVLAAVQHIKAKDAACAQLAALLIECAPRHHTMPSLVYYALSTERIPFSLSNALSPPFPPNNYTMLASCPKARILLLSHLTSAPLCAPPLCLPSIPTAPSLRK